MNDCVLDESDIRPTIRQLAVEVENALNETSISYELNTSIFGVTAIACEPAVVLKYSDAGDETNVEAEQLGRVAEPT